VARRSHGRRLATLALAFIWIAATAAAQATATGADVPLVVDGKRTTRAKVESQLSPPVREALDAWTEAAGRLDLDIVLGQGPEHLVLGHARSETLVECARWMDESFALLDALVPLAGPRSRKATVAILVDEKFVHSPAWGQLLDELKARQLLIEQAAEYLRGDPDGVTLRSTPLFLQPTYDLTGEGEFRLPNEVAHKLAQCLLTSRTGQQPPEILWGIGYVVEQRLFESSYLYRLREFVYSSSHFDWRREARKELDSRRKAKDFSLVPFVADDEAAGKPQPAQLLVWAALSYLCEQRPEALSGLLLELSALQAEVDPYGAAPTYAGDAARTREALVKVFDAIDPAALSDWLGAKPKQKQSRPGK
jgi:hypothetical protein